MIYTAHIKGQHLGKIYEYRMPCGFYMLIAVDRKGCECMYPVGKLGDAIKHLMFKTNQYDMEYNSVMIPVMVAS